MGLISGRIAYFDVDLSGSGVDYTDEIYKPMQGISIKRSKS